MEALRSVFGIIALLVIAFAISNNRRAINPRTVLAALALQLAIGALALFVPLGRDALGAIARGVGSILQNGESGIEFMFGGLVGPKMFEVFGKDGFSYALRVLPLIIFVTALIAVLYYLHVMKWIIKIIGSLLAKIMGISSIEAYSAVATIFLGQQEIPALVKPFIKKLSGPQIFAVMSSGMASVAGAALAGYAMLGVKMEYLIAASFMAVPGGILFGKIICPVIEPNQIEVDSLEFDEKRAANVIEAAAAGGAVGMKIAVYVAAMLITFIGLIALLNNMVSGITGYFGFHDVTLQYLLGIIFSPIAWLIGVPWHDASIAGNFIGVKLILNEYVAYTGLAPYLQATTQVIASGLQVLSPKTLTIVSFALCGFANFSSIAILTGSFGAIDPEVRGRVAKYGLRALASATLSNLMSATIAGLFVSLAAM
ncbi:NupC/NupG family nucleoside CNT transporter [Trinickia sp. EG282A]|uniref:NupC/NupG family nucleoside CNT transporter n=1 Tax=Trinickia sp. EG282A TaxID=3237013 RepID=UPI0034D314EB